MLRRGHESERTKRRPDVAAGGPGTRPGPPTDPFVATPAAGAPDAPPLLHDWIQLASFQELDPPLVAELARASMGSSGVVVMQSGEVAVGAMLASLAIRGRDDLIGQLIVTGNAELRLHRYAVGQLEPIAVHRTDDVADALRSLAWCAATGAEGTFELVADDGQGMPIAVGAARHHELRWLQPPPPSSPHDAPWAPISTNDRPPGADRAWWKGQLERTPVRPEPAPLPSSFTDISWQPASSSDGLLADAIPAAPAPSPAPGGTPAHLAVGSFVESEEGLGFDPAELLDVVGASVNQALSEALVELEIDPGALEELRENPVLDDVQRRVGQIEQLLRHLGPVNRQVHELTTVVEELADTVRSLVRQQWDAAPPQNYWSRSQRTSDELQRALDDLTSEIRTRFPRE